jgi:hypothetical protein
MIERIKSVGKRELMREARIAMRTIEAARVGQDVAADDLKRMADAAELIASRQKGVRKPTEVPLNTRPSTRKP